MLFPVHRVRPWLLVGMLGAAVVNAVAIEPGFHRAPPGSSIEQIARQSPVAAPVRDELADAGDFYTVAGGRKIALLRAKNSVAVRFVPGADAPRSLAGLRTRGKLPDHETVARLRPRGGGGLEIVRARQRGATLDARAISADAAVEIARPVLVDRQTHSRMIATDEILAAFAPQMSPAQVRAAVGAAGLSVVARKTSAPGNIQRLRLRRPKIDDPLAVARQLGATPGVLWAQPNFLREVRHLFTPGNTLFAGQQALRNIGQNQGTAGADVDAESAWEITQGSASVVIAIIDDGVDTSHPGLRIFQNPGESGGGRETNGIDDDGNGRVDDVKGWDFADGDNDPSPIGTNGHGTGCAGVAAGNFSSFAPTVGIAGGCTILPVKIAGDDGAFSTDENIGDAILYAAQRADVLSNSWGGGSESPFINAAIEYAVTQGRGGKGCPVFFAAGNFASGWYSGGSRYRLSTAGLSGSYYFSFFFERGPTSNGTNSVRIDNVSLLAGDGYTHLTTALPDEDFETWVAVLPFFNFPPAGWWLASKDVDTPSWIPSATDALTGTGGTISAQSPDLVDGQYAWLLSPLVPITGGETFAFAASVSVASDSALYVPVYDAALTFVGYWGPITGEPEFIGSEVLYPASHPAVISVGASTDRDLRSDYSQFDGHLDFVAPSNGGWNDIATLDPVGATGWTPQHYKMNFGGTSAATPLAAGTAALMLSVNPNLTAEQVRTKMQETCDKIGGVTYDPAGRNRFYGSGRVNAAAAVAAVDFAVAIGDATTVEPLPGDTATLTFPLTLSQAAMADVTVGVDTQNVTAIAGVNFIGKSTTVTIPAGTVSVPVSVTVQGGALQVPAAKFQVAITGPAFPRLSRPMATGTIVARDADGDGVGDFWETANGFSNENADDALNDADGDGQSNLAEYLAGTDPWNAVNRISLNVSANPNGVTLSFASAPYRTFRIEYAGTPNATVWQSLGSDIAGTGAIVLRSDPTGASVAGRRFYRLRCGL